MREGWKYEKLGDVFKTSSGGTPLKSNKVFYENGCIPWVNSGEVCKKYIDATSNYITDEGLRNSSAKIFPVDTVLVAMYGATAAQAGILKIEASTNQAVCGLLPNDNVISEFIYYWFIYNKEKVAAMAQGGAQPNLSQIKIKSLIIPIPPLSEQHRIVELLDAEFAKIDAIKANAEKQLQDAKDLFQSALKDLLTPKEGWKEKNIVDICSDIFAGGDAPKDRKKEKEKDYKYPIYSNGIEQKGLYGFTNTYRVNKQSITIAARGTIGVAFIRMEPFTPIVRLVTLIPDLNVVDINFLCYLIQGHDWSNTGAAIPQLTIPMVKDVNLYLPTLVNQQLIAEKLDSLSEKVKQLQSSYEKTITLCNDLKQSILKDIFG